MEPNKNLAPCFIGSGTLVKPIDMCRALETLEALDYVYEVDGEVIAEGSATLVKLSYDINVSTMILNGCLFLNAASFSYMDFTHEDEQCVVSLYGDGTTLTLRSDKERDVVEVPRGQLRLLEDAAFDASFVFADDEDEED